MGCIDVGNGPIAGGTQQLPHGRGVTTATNLGSAYVLHSDGVNLHSGTQQTFLHVSKILKNKKHEGKELESSWVL